MNNNTNNTNNSNNSNTTNTINTINTPKQPNNISVSDSINSLSLEDSETIKDALQKINIEYTEEDVREVITSLNCCSEIDINKMLINPTSTITELNNIINNKTNIQPISTTEYIIKDTYNTAFEIHVNLKEKKIYKCSTSKQDNTINTMIITAVPTELIVYNDKITQNKTKSYKCTWKYNNNDTIEITGNIKDHETELIKKSGVYKKNALSDVISIVFDYYESNKLTTNKYVPPHEGIYFNEDYNNPIVIIEDHKEYKPTTEQLKHALNTLQDLSLFMKDTTKLAEIIRWSIGAPYHYYCKQLGLKDDLTHIYLWGESDTGKTTGYGHLILYLNDLDMDKHLFSGGASSIAQVTNVLSQTTYPVVYDEVVGLFDKKDNGVKTNLAVLKEAVREKKSRHIMSKSGNNKATYIDALASCCYTANNDFEDSESGGLNKRYDKYWTGINERITKEDKAKYYNHFNFKSQYDNTLKQNLKYIGYDFQQYIINNPLIFLEKGLNKTIHDYIANICTEYNHNDILEWIFKEYDKETINDTHIRKQELIIGVIKQCITRTAKYVQVRESEALINENVLDAYKDEDNSINWSDVIRKVANSQEIPWLKPKINRKTKETSILITYPIIPELQKNNITINTFKQLANDMDWKQPESKRAYYSELNGYSDPIKSIEIGLVELEDLFNTD